MFAKRIAGIAGATGVALTLLTPALLGRPDAAYAQSAGESAGAEHVEGGVPIAHLIATVAKKTGKKFVLDPRVRGDVVLVGQDPANISYNDLLTILMVNGFAGIEAGGYVMVMPSANVRQEPLPQVTGKESYPDSEFVSKVIQVKSASAAQLVPILRPMLPQVAHLVALPCTNTLLIVDTFAKIQHIQSIIESLDVGEPFKAGNCEYSMQQAAAAAAQRAAGTPPSTEHAEPAPR